MARITIGPCARGTRGPRSQALVSPMESSVADVASLRRYMDQLRMNYDDGDDTRYPVQEESVQCVFEMVADLVSKRGDWKNWDWKEDFGSSLTIDDLVRARQALFTPDEFDEDRMTEAHKAASRGNENVVVYAVYVAQNVDTLNHPDEHGRTILHHASGRCSAELCRLVVVKGGDVGSANAWGDTPLHVAARYGRVDHLKAMLMTLTKPEVGKLYFRAPYRSIPGDAVTKMNHDGKQPLHLAAEACPAERRAVSVLVKCGRADIDATVSSLSLSSASTQPVTAGFVDAPADDIVASSLVPSTSTLSTLSASTLSTFALAASTVFW